MSLKQQQSLELRRLQDEEGEVKTVGSWTFQENLLYVVFLQKNKVIMQSKRKRRNQRVFDLMASFIGSRTSLQCRSHHQKFLEKLGDIKSIINNFKKYLTKEDFRQHYLEIVRKSQSSPADIKKKGDLKLQEQSSENQLGKFKNSAALNDEEQNPEIKNEAELNINNEAVIKQTEKLQNKDEGQRELEKHEAVRFESGGKSEDLAMNESPGFSPQFQYFPFLGFQTGLMNYPYMAPFFPSLGPYY